MYLQFKIQITLMALNFSAVRYNHNSQTGFEHEEMRYAYLGISKWSQLLCRVWYLVIRYYLCCFQTVVVVWQLLGSRQAVVRQSSGSRQAVVRQSSGSRQAVIR